MKLPVINSVDDVVARQLCAGCGACAAVSDGSIEMIDTFAHGRRPRIMNALSATVNDDALTVCPGIRLEHVSGVIPRQTIKSLRAGWGPVLEVWEGYASDPRIRFAGSSGGAATALALACIEALDMEGVVHIKAREDVPYLNRTVFSRSRDELIEATGSRYAPASPCEGLPWIERAQRPCVFIGKPCDVAAAGKARRIRPMLDRNLGLTIAIFCAGTPMTRATLRMLTRMGIHDTSTLRSLRYRGNGWPGDATAITHARDGRRTARLSYDDAWGGVLTNDKQWRCHVCADHTGEFADISVGDPWHRPIDPDDPGRSLVIVRTERGRDVLHRAIAAGYLTLQRTTPTALPSSQPNLLRARGAVWARILICRILGIAAPRYRGMPMFRFWWSTLSIREKLRSVAGTVRRVLDRRLRDPITIEPFEPELQRPTAICKMRDLQRAA